MKKITSSTSVTRLLQTGSYELNDITDFIYNKLKDYNLKNTSKIQSNNNSLQVEITTLRESVYFNKKGSVGQLFGFHQKVLEPHPTETYRSDQTASILKNIQFVWNVI